MDRLKRNQRLFTVIAVALVGAGVLAFSRAATPTVSLDFDDVATTLSGCATRFNDALAVKNSAIKFGCADPSSVLSLDATGKTIPAHDYAVPTTGKVIYVSPKGVDKTSNSVDGNDANDGLTLSTPVETLGAAYGKVKATGGTVVFRGGTYRSWYTTDGGNTAGFVSAEVSFQAYRQENPWFVGTDPVTDGWSSAGSGVWKRSWSTPNFCKSHFDGGAVGYRQKAKRLDGAMVSPVTSGTRRGEAIGPQSGLAEGSENEICVWPDNLWTRSDRPVEVDGDPQMAFIGDQELTQRKSLAELSTNGNSFYYDWDNEVIYVNKDPAANTIELAKRHALLIFAGANNFQWKGIGVKRFASSNLDSVIYAGLGSDNATKGSLVVENSVFSENAGGTLSLNDAKQATTIRRSVFARNYFSGMGTNGFAGKAQPQTWRNDITIDASAFASNNRGLMDSACSASCAAAGIKLNNMVGYTIKNSLFEDNNGTAHGMWCDIDCSDGKMVNNIVRNNGGHGIFYEISSKGIIASNLVYHNNWTGIVVLSASTKIYNNTIVNKVGSNVQAVWIMDDDRPAPDKGETWPYTVAAMQAAHASLGVGYAVRVGPNTNATEFANNLIVSQPTSGARLLNFANNGIPRAPNTTSPDYFAVLNNNIFYRVSGQPLYAWGTNGNIQSSADLRSVSGQNWEQNTIDVVGTSDPFINRATTDFRLKTDSQAYINKGMVLPADVAAAIGVSASQYPRGAINWPR